MTKVQDPAPATHGQGPRAWNPRPGIQKTGPRTQDLRLRTKKTDPGLEVGDQGLGFILDTVWTSAQVIFVAWKS